MARNILVFLVIGGVALFLCSVSSAIVPHMINYQGKLTTVAAGCLNDTVEMIFSIYSDTLGPPADWSETQTEVVVRDGIFSVLLGSVDTIPAAVFDGNIKYLGVQVESDPEMRPLKPMVSVAYAYRSVESDIAAFALSAAPDDDWDVDTAGFSVYRLTGNVGIGTPSPQEKVDVAGTAQVTGFKMPTGAVNNHVLTSDASGVGTWRPAVGGADSDWSLNPSDGGDTTLTTGGAWGIARYGNTLYGNADSTHINLGVTCTTGTSGQNYKYCTAGGGLGNTASGNYATVGGGCSNTAGNEYATVGGGVGNAASGYLATVGGGLSNSASNSQATVGGGAGDTASGNYSTVPGGRSNKAAGDYSFAAGRRAKANHSGSFVWADNTNEDFASTDNNQFLIRASGNVGIGTTTPTEKLQVNGTIHSTSGGFKFPDGTVQVTAAGGADGWIDDGTVVRLETDSDSVGIGSTTPAEKLDVLGNIKASGTITSGNSITIDGVNAKITASGGTIDLDDENLITAGKATIGPSNVNTGSNAFVVGEGNTAGGGWSNVGGGQGNEAGNVGTTVGGGVGNYASGYIATIGGGNNNTAGGRWSTIAGGVSNATNDTASAVGGGRNNKARGPYSVVAGGGGPTDSDSNSASGDWSTVSGGLSNTASGDQTTVAGGEGNWVSGGHAAVGGGEDNSAHGGYATIAGGWANEISGAVGAIGGGAYNRIRYACDYSAIPGGYADTLTLNADYSMGFGRTVYVDDGEHVIFFDGTYSGHFNLNRDHRDAAPSSYPIRVGTHTGNGDGAYLTGGGVWTDISSRSKKEDFQQLDGGQVLDKIEGMTVTNWKLKGTEERHIGPVAEDFYRAFGCGSGIPEDDSTSIAAMDLAGVSLAAVRELTRIVREQQKEIVSLKAQVEALQTGRR